MAPDLTALYRGLASAALGLLVCDRAMATPTDDPAMTEDSAALAVDVPILLAVGAIAVAVGQAVYTRVWSGDGGSKPTLHYQEGSRLCPEIIRRCRTLKEK